MHVRPGLAETKWDFARNFRRAVLTLASILLLATPLWVVAPGNVSVAGGAPRPAGRVVTLSRHCAGVTAVVDRAGTATAVWATHWWRGPIMASRRPAAGAWSRPVQIGYGTAPRAVVDAKGDVTVVYQTNRRGFTSGLSAVRRSPGKPWTRPAHLTVDRPAPGYHGEGGEGIYGAHRTDLAVNSAGDLVVVWQWGSFDRDKPFRIEVARRPAGGGWHSPTPLTNRNWAENPVLGVDAAGRATVIYHHDRDLMSRRYVPGSGWASAVRIGGADPIVEKDLVVTPHGASVLALQSYRVRQARAAVVERPPAGPWGRTRVLSRARANVSDVSAAVDGTGTPVVAWGLYSGRIVLVRRNGGHWSTPFTVTASAHSGYPPLLAVNAVGDLAVTWADKVPAPTLARVRDHTGHWTPAFTVWPTHGYYDSDITEVYPHGDLLSLVQDGTVLRARRVRLP